MTPEHLQAWERSRRFEVRSELEREQMEMEIRQGVLVKQAE